MIRTFRVVYGQVRTSYKDFQTIEGVLAFVRRSLKRHSDWTIGDSWRDEISVVQFVLDSDGTPVARNLSDFVRSRISVEG